MVEIEVQRARNFDHVDTDDVAAEAYRITYQVLVRTWVKSDGYEPTLRHRDDMGTAVRIALLLSLSLGQPNKFAINPRTLAEDFYPAVAAKGDRFISQITHAFEIRVDESLVREPLGDADLVTILTGTLPKAPILHPAL
jgi:hypothetical protein